MSSKIELKFPALHPGQERVLRESRRFNVCRMGRRWGKSTLGRHLVSHTAIDRFPAAWIAPTYKYLLPQWREVCELLRPVIVSKSEEEKHLKLIGGGELDFWSADGGPPGEGRRYKRLVFDEAAMMGAQLESLWTRSLRPTLADFQGDAWFLSTSKAANAYFNTLWQYGQGEREDYMSWQLGTADNPFIPRSEIEAARRDLPLAAFNQEFLGDATAWNGTVFTNLEAAIIDAPLEDRYQGRSAHPWTYGAPEFFIGCDWSGAGRKAAGDFTCFVVLASESVGRSEFSYFMGSRRILTVCAIERFKADFGMQRVKLQGLYNRFRPDAVLAEANSIGAPAIYELRKLGLPVHSWTATNATKAAGVESLALGFENSLIRIPDIPNRAALLAELVNFEATPLGNGMTRFAAGAGGHDDAVMALLIANNAATVSKGGPRPGYVA